MSQLHKLFNGGFAGAEVLKNSSLSGVEGRTFKMTRFDSAQRAAIFYYQLVIRLGKLTYEMPPTLGRRLITILKTNNTIYLFLREIQHQ